MIKNLIILTLTICVGILSYSVQEQHGAILRLSTHILEDRASQPQKIGQGVNYKSAELASYLPKLPVKALRVKP